MKLPREFIGNKKKVQKYYCILLIICLMISGLNQYLFPGNAQGAVTTSYLRFDRLSTGAAISGTACINTTTSGTEAKVTIVFPLGWTISTTASNWTTSTSNLPDGATAWTSIGATASTVNGLSVTFSSGDLSSSTLYCFNFAGASSTIGSAGNDQTGELKTLTSSNVLIDRTYNATSIVASNADQITVTASVSATMTFSLSTNSLSLGTLSTSSVASASATQTVSTNGAFGYISWVKGANADGLHSTTANAGISSPGTYPTVTDLASTTGYGLEVQPVSGNPVIATGYWAGGSSTKVGKIDTTFNQTASYTGPVASNQVSINVHAKIPSTQAAATDYTDTLTVVAAGNF